MKFVIRRNGALLNDYGNSLGWKYYSSVDGARGHPLEFDSFDTASAFITSFPVFCQGAIVMPLCTPHYHHRHVAISGHPLVRTACADEVTFTLTLSRELLERLDKQLCAIVYGQSERGLSAHDAIELLTQLHCMIGKQVSAQHVVR